MHSNSRKNNLQFSFVKRIDPFVLVFYEASFEVKHRKTENFSDSVSARFWLSQPMLLNPIFGMFSLWRNFNKDHHLLLFLTIWSDTALFKKYTHKYFGWSWTRDVSISLIQPQPAHVMNLIFGMFYACFLWNKVNKCHN